jgi:hypothetical protein
MTFSFILSLDGYTPTLAECASMRDFVKESGIQEESWNERITM